MDRVFFHGTGDSDYAFDNMIKIIETGGIKSLNKQNSSMRGLVNGEDYISVCAWDDDIDCSVESMASSFNGWIFGCPCFVISPDIEAIKCGRYHDNYDSNKERVSQFMDEWHVKDFIPLDKIIGIALPFKDEEFIERNKDKVDKIMKYASEYEFQIFESDESLISNTRNIRRR